MKNYLLILTLGLLTLVNTQPMHAMEVYENQLIVSELKATLAGGILGGSLGMAAHLYKNYSSKKTVWQNIKSCPWYFMAISGAIGAIGANYAVHNFTARTYYYDKVYPAFKALEDDVELNEQYLASLLGTSEITGSCVYFPDEKPSFSYDSFKLRFEKITEHLKFVRDYYYDFAVLEKTRLSVLKERLDKVALSLYILSKDASDLDYSVIDLRPIFFYRDQDKA